MILLTNARQMRHPHLLRMTLWILFNNQVRYWTGKSLTLALHLLSKTSVIVDLYRQGTFSQRIAKRTYWVIIVLRTLPEHSYA